MVLFHQARGRQPQHARIPALAGKHDGAAGGEIEIPQRFLRLVENGVFHIAARAVFRVQFFGQGFGARPVLGQEQFQPAPGAAQPPAGVEAGPQLEPQMPGGERAVFQPGDALEGGDAPAAGARSCAGGRRGR